MHASFRTKMPSVFQDLCKLLSLISESRTNNGWVWNAPLWTWIELLPMNTDRIHPFKRIYQYCILTTNPPTQMKHSKSRVQTKIKNLTTYFNAQGKKVSIPVIYCWTFTPTNRGSKGCQYCCTLTLFQNPYIGKMICWPFCTIHALWNVILLHS